MARWRRCRSRRKTSATVYFWLINIQLSMLDAMLIWYIRLVPVGHLSPHKAHIERKFELSLCRRLSRRPQSTQSWLTYSGMLGYAPHCWRETFDHLTVYLFLIERKCITYSKFSLKHIRTDIVEINDRSWKYKWTHDSGIQYGPSDVITPLAYHNVE